MPFRAVLFDLDGVLIFSKEVWFHLLNATARHFAVPEVTRGAFEAGWGQGIAADVEQFFPLRSIAEVEAYYNAHFMDFARHITVESDARNVFAALETAGVTAAVVTNTPTQAAVDILASAALRPATVVGSTDVPHPKPAPDMLLLALERLGVAADAAVMVGDTRFDREAAAAAGVFFAGYRTPGDARLERLADLLPLLDGSNKKA